MDLHEGVLRQLKSELQDKDLLSTGISDRTLDLFDEIFLSERTSMSQIRDMIQLRDELLASNPAIPEALAEQCRYRLALEFNIQNPLVRAKCLIFNSQVSEAEALAKELTHRALIEKQNGFDDESAATLMIANVIEVLCLRNSGSLDSAWKLFESKVQFENSKLTDRDRAEMFLIKGSLTFNLSDYETSSLAYMEAYELWKKLGRRGKTCIAAFDVSIALHYLGRQLDCNYWLWIAEDILQTYANSSVKNTIDLSRLEYRVEQQRYEDARQVAMEFVARRNLIVVQQVSGYQALATAALETGHILDCEVALMKAQRFMNENNFYQYELFQKAIEINLKTLLHRDIRRIKSSQTLNQQADLRAQNQFKMAQARQAYFENDLSRMHKIVQEIGSKPSQLAEDLQLLCEGILVEIPRTSRAMEIYFFLSVQKKRLQYLRMLRDELSHRQRNPWQEVIFQLSHILVRLHEGATVSQLREKIVAVIDTCDQSGFERLSSVGLGILAMLDSSAMPQWLKRLNEMNAVDHTWLEKLMSDLNEGQYEHPRRIVVNGEQNLVANENLPRGNEPFDIEYHSEERALFVKGKEVPIKGIPLLVIESLLRAPLRGLSKEDLIQQVWRQNYDPMTHDPLVYSTISRIRDLIDVDCESGFYRLSSKLKTALIDGQSVELTHRQRAIIDLFATVGADIQRNNIVNSLNISERTALRELCELTRLGVLEKNGAGRGTCYRLRRMS